MFRLWQKIMCSSLNMFSGPWRHLPYPSLPPQESFTREMGRTSSSPSSLLSSALWWGMVFTGASPVVQAAVAPLETWCCLPPWHWPAALMALSTWETSTSSAGCILMDTPEQYWSSSKPRDLVEYACDKSRLILGGISHSGKQWDSERWIDSSTNKTKLTRLLWVRIALALDGICGCDLFDLNRMHSEICLHANAECMRFRHHSL